MSITETYDKPKRIALVVGALTGHELKAGSRDVSRIHEILTDPDLGECSISDSPSPVHKCSSVSDFEESVLKDLFKKWRQKDQLLFYFTGHGRIESGMFCLQLGPDKDDLLPFESLLLKMRLYKVDRAILIIDTCFSGEATKSSDLFSPPENLPKGVAIISSSRPTQISHELEDGSASVFTDVFYDGIKTGLGGSPTSDGKIAVEDIVDFIKDELEHNEKYAEYDQRPQFKITQADRSIWVSKNKSGPEEELEPDPNPSVVLSPQVIVSMDELKFLAENTPLLKHPCPEATIDDLGWDLVELFLNEIYPEIDKRRSKEDIIDEVKFLSPIPHLGQQKLHKSAVLCFANRPELFYPQAKSIFVLGNEGDKRFVRETVTGPLSKQVTGLMKRVINRLDQTSSIAQDGKRLQKLEINEYVIRELISNAITHRDYNLNGSVKVSLNDEFLEIVSPGDFPFGTSWDGFLKNTSAVSQPINIIISHYLAHLLVFEGIGRGFEIIREHIKEYGEDSIICTLLPGPVVSIRVHRQMPISSANVTTEHSNTVETLKELIERHTRRLSLLELKKARAGLDSPPEVQIEIEDVEQKLSELKAELSNRQGVITQSPDKEIESLQERITVYNRRLQILQEQKHIRGVDASPSILMEIEYTEQEIAELQAKLTELKQD